MGIKQRRKAVAVFTAFTMALSMASILRVGSVVKADSSISGPITDDDGEVSWDLVEFGNYYQTAKFNKQPVKWRILSVDNEKKEALVIADRALECKKLSTDVWSKSELRNLLNDKLYNEMFDENEQSAIIDVSVSDEDSSGIVSKDKMYVLSQDEYNTDSYGFTVDAKYGVSKFTDKTYGVYMDNVANTKGVSGLNWFLRSFSGSKYDGIDFSGNVIKCYYECGIRPVMKIKTDSEYVVSDGTIDNDGNCSDINDGYNNPVINGSDVVWDCVTIGNYYQDATYEKEPVEWRVLSVDKANNKALLLSDKILEYISFDTDYTENTVQSILWDESKSKEWLNGEFYDSLFSSSEKNAILSTDLRLSDTNGDYVSSDNKLIILSDNDLMNPDYGFYANNDNLSGAINETKYSYMTDRVFYKGLFDRNNNVCSYGDYFIGETNGYNNFYSIPYTLTKLYFRLNRKTDYVGNVLTAIRPAVYVDLSKIDLVKAGTVTAPYGNIPEPDVVDGIEINETNFPDDAFRNYILNNINKDDNSTLSEEEIKNATIFKMRGNYTNKENSISNLKGIEYFPYIISLDCSYNSITELDISKNKRLLYLNCENNYIETLILNKCLKKMECSYNPLNGLDISECTKLTNLQCSSSNLSELNLKNNKRLSFLWCSSDTEEVDGYSVKNTFTELDLSENINLKELRLGYLHFINGLDLSNNINLSELNCNNCDLTQIDLSKNTALKRVDVDYNNLTSLDLSGKINLERLSCSSNSIESLNISSCKNLEWLECENNKLKSLNIGDNPNIERLYCYGNEIESVDVGNLDLDSLKYYSSDYMVSEYGIYLDKENKLLKFGVTEIPTPIPTASPSPTPTGAEEQPEITPTESPELEPTQNPEPAQNPEPVVTQIPDQGSAQNPDPAQVPVQTPDQGTAQSQLPTPAPVAPATGNTGNTLAVGAVVADTSNTAKYVVVGAAADGTGKVAFAESVSKDVKSLTIPDTVNLDGTEYKVTEIRPKALKNRKKLKSVTIGKNVEKIGGNAFQGCGKLKKINIKTTLLTKKSVGAKAFSKIGKNPTVKVPKSKKKEYKKWIFKKGLPKKAKIK